MALGFCILLWNNSVDTFVCVCMYMYVCSTCYIQMQIINYQTHNLRLNSDNITHTWGSNRQRERERAREWTNANMLQQHCERSLSLVVALSRVRSLPVRRPVMAGWLVGALARPCQCRVCIRTDSLCREQHQASARLSAEQSSRSSSNSSAVAAQQRLAKLQSVCFVDIFQKEEAKCKAKLNNFCSVCARVACACVCI